MLITHLYQYIKVAINVFMYKYNLHSLVPEMSSCIAFSPLFTSFYPLFSPRICQKYVKSETDLCLRRGHFPPLVEGVRLLPNPLIFASYLLKLKNCWFSFPAYKSKEDLHFSAYKAFAPTWRLADCYHTQVDALG